MPAGNSVSSRTFVSPGSFRLAGLQPKCDEFGSESIYPDRLHKPPVTRIGQVNSQTPELDRGTKGGSVDVEVCHFSSRSS